MSSREIRAVNLTPSQVVDFARGLRQPFTRQQLVDECVKQDGDPPTNSTVSEIEEVIWSLMHKGQLQNDGFGNLTVHPA
jgi:hypothetical protein